MNFTSGFYVTNFGFSEAVVVAPSLDADPAIASVN